MVNTKLDVQFCEHISDEANPKYLGVTLDRSLTFQQHLENTHNKLNIVHQCGLTAVTLNSLNNAMRIVSGTLRLTPVDWLRVLSHILPPQIRRAAQTSCFPNHVNANARIPLHHDLQNPPKARLKSRNLLWNHIKTLTPNLNAEAQCRVTWSISTAQNKQLIVDPVEDPPSFDLSERLVQFESHQDISWEM
ncbi:hypothetical protein KIL84_019284 [Mauremys mutica]|uniref:Uncharacterized protein n=1 Tax=Mauremys mutica TaxID=74926 RepID=A0A9D3XWP1_9SAUR|nr:hypothetical protein KIL84_019284 [Mauremys mutica]